MLAEQQITRAKRLYVRGDIELDRFEEIVAASLRGEEVDLGDWTEVLVLPRGGSEPGIRLRQWL